MTQVDVYKSEITAMTGLLDAEKTKIEANKLQFDAWARSSEIAVQVYNGKVELYKAGSQTEIAQAEMLNRQSDAQARITVGTMEASARYAEMATRSIIARETMQMEAARGVATAAASLAAGAMAAVNAHAAVTYSESE